jgi:hypothetical protein
MNVPTFPAPSTSVISHARTGHRIAAARMWMKEASVVLEDGREVSPKMRLAYDLAAAIAKGMPAIGVVVEEGSYELASANDSREAASRLKSERFALFMEEDKPAPIGVGVCDTCGVLGSVNNHYASDGMGYPTLVLQTCPGACKKSE